MREKAKRIRWLYIITLISFLLSALSIVLIPIIDIVPETQKKVCTICIAAVFWGGLIAGIVFTVLTCLKIKPIRRGLCRKGRLKPIKAPGVVRFGKEPFRIVLYAVMIICIAAAATDLFFHWLPPVGLFIILALAYIAFAAHCIIDGKNFNTYQFIKEGKEK